jgi:hypothetical protein
LPCPLPVCSPLSFRTVSEICVPTLACSSSFVFPPSNAELVFVPFSIVFFVLLFDLSTFCLCLFLSVCSLLDLFLFLSLSHCVSQPT